LKVLARISDAQEKALLLNLAGIQPARLNRRDEKAEATEKVFPKHHRVAQWRLGVKAAVYARSFSQPVQI
jgi:hypothetical protein